MIFFFFQFARHDEKQAAPFQETSPTNQAGKIYLSINLRCFELTDQQTISVDKLITPAITQREQSCML